MAGSDTAGVPAMVDFGASADMVSDKAENTKNVQLKLCGKGRSSGSFRTKIRVSEVRKQRGRPQYYKQWLEQEKQ